MPPEQHRHALAPLATNLDELRPGPLGDEAAGSAYSPLESLGRRVGLARSRSLRQVPKDELPLQPASKLLPPPPPLHRPAVAVTAPPPPARSSPLVFSAFRHSRSSSSGSTAYTSSIYSTASGDTSAYWAGPNLSADMRVRPSASDDGADDSDGERTERGDPSDDDDDDDGATEQGHHRPDQVLGRPVDSPAETSFSSSDFTTSSRLSRFLDDSLVADSPVDDHPGFSQQIPLRGLNIGDVVPGSGSGWLSSFTQSAQPPEPSYTPPRAGSVGTVAQRAAGAVDVQSVYGLAGGTWHAPQPDGQRSVGNFSRPRVGSAAPPAGSAGASSSSFVPRPQRNASLRQSPDAASRSPSQHPDTTRTTVLPFRLSTQPTSFVLFSHQDSPPPPVPPKSTSSHPAPARPPAPAPKVVLLPSQNQALFQGQTHARPPAQPVRGESSASVATSSGTLPRRKAPPPPVDRPAFSVPPELASATQIVRLPSAKHSPAVTSTARFGAGPTLPSARPGELFVPGPPSAPSSPQLAGSQFEPPPPLRVARQGSGETLHPGSYSIYSLPTTPTQPGMSTHSGSSGNYTKVEVASPLASPDLPPSPRGPVRRASATTTAQQHLELGLAHLSRGATEKDHLALAAGRFRSAATVEGGCRGGWLFYGLALRSGWGVVKDDRQAFAFLQRAAADGAAISTSGAGSAAAAGGSAAAVVESELVVAILEVGTCLLNGWGCKKDPTRALAHFLAAARLNDPDAMVATALQLERGLGCPGGKKRKADAAYWWRTAGRAGVELRGRAWIWKRKYDTADGAGAG